MSCKLNNFSCMTFEASAPVAKTVRNIQVQASIIHFWSGSISCFSYSLQTSLEEKAYPFLNPSFSLLNAHCQLRCSKVSLLSKKQSIRGMVSNYPTTFGNSFPQTVEWLSRFEMYFLLVKLNFIPCLEVTAISKVSHVAPDTFVQRLT